MPSLDPTCISPRLAFLSLVLVFSAMDVAAKAVEKPRVLAFQGRLALLPLENLTGRQKSISVVLPCLSKELERRGFSLVPQADLRTLVRKHRIRSVGKIGQTAAGILGKEAGVDYIAIGAVNVFEEGKIPEIGVTLRILEARTAKVLWAGNGSASGHDRVWAFGLGTVTDMEILSRQVVENLLKPMPACLTHQCLSENINGYTAAIVPFENLSNDVHAADIVTNIILPRLYAMNLDVLEPGLVEELMADRKTISRGEIDLATMDEIKKRYHVDFIIPGSVDQFEPGRGDERTANPMVEMSIRYLWTGSRSVAGLMGCVATGKEHDFIFGTGREYSIANLVVRQIHTLLDLQPFTQTAKPEVGLK